MESKRSCKINLKLIDDKDYWAVLTANIDGRLYSTNLTDSDLPHNLTDKFVYACTIQEFIDSDGSKDKGVACDDEACILSFTVSILNKVSHRRIILERVESKKD